MNRLCASVIFGAATALLTPLGNTQADEALVLQRFLSSAAQAQVAADLSAGMLGALQSGAGSGDFAFAPGAPDPAISWLLALGFLGVVVTRRLG